jgi:hypothetical protein
MAIINCAGRVRGHHEHASRTGCLTGNCHLTVQHDPFARLGVSHLEMWWEGVALTMSAGVTTASGCWTCPAGIDRGPHYRQSRSAGSTLDLLTGPASSSRMAKPLGGAAAERALQRRYGRGGR